MARYLIIEFEDNDQAEALRAQIDAATRKGKKFRVVGLFARPGRNCRCSNTRAEFVKRITKEAKPVRGATYGWWVCPDCKRPRFGNQYPTNLIKPTEIIDPQLYTEIPWLSDAPKQEQFGYYVSEIDTTVEPAHFFQR